MTGQPRKPIFGFVFGPRPQAPGSPALTWSRVPPRGPWRLALLITASFALAALAGSAFLAAVASRSFSGLAVAATGLAAVGICSLLAARAWVLGTYVNDSGVRIVRIWRTDHLPWSAISGIRLCRGIIGSRIHLDTGDGGVSTSIGSFTLDTAGRSETWSMAVDRMHTWWRESRPETRLD